MRIGKLLTKENCLDIIPSNLKSDMQGNIYIFVERLVLGISSQ